jgi:hypothetical protein
MQQAACCDYSISQPVCASTQDQHTGNASSAVLQLLLLLLLLQHAAPPAIQIPLQA